MDSRRRHLFEGLGRRHVDQWQVSRRLFEFIHRSLLQLSSLLVNLARYTKESDIYQIGVMLMKVDGLSEEGRAAAQKLKEKSLSAEEALSLPYFQQPLG
jgi:hypothetical protein